MSADTGHYTYPRHREQHWTGNRPADCPHCARENAVRTCTCIRRTCNPAIVSVPDPDCPAHAQAAPASLYASAQRDAATGLGRLLILLAGLALACTGIYVAFAARPMSGGHLIGAPALIVLGAICAYIALKETP